MDAYVAVEKALNPEQYALIRQRWDRINPHQAGAPVADIIDMHRDVDARLDLTEPWWEAHGDQIPAGEHTHGYPLWGAALMAVILAGIEQGVPSFEAVQELVARAKAGGAAP